MLPLGLADLAIPSLPGLDSRANCVKALTNQHFPENQEFVMLVSVCRARRNIYLVTQAGFSAMMSFLLEQDAEVGHDAEKDQFPSTSSSAS